MGFSQTETNRVRSALAAMASLGATRSIAHHQHQTRLGATTRRALPAAYEPQACELGRGVDPRLFSRIRLGRNLPLPQLRARAVTGCASPFIHHDLTGCNRSVVHSTVRQQASHYGADVIHLNRLSKPSSAGFKTSWKDLTFEAEPLSSDDKIHD